MTTLNDIRKAMTPEMEARWVEAMRGSHVRPGLRFGVSVRSWDHTRTVWLAPDRIHVVGLS